MWCETKRCPGANLTWCSLANGSTEVSLRSARPEKVAVWERDRDAAVNMQNPLALVVDPSKFDECNDDEEHTDIA